MTLHPKIMQAIEHLDYRATVGDVAVQAGLDINFAQQGLLALASDAGGHLQVAESGDVVYLFPKNFRTILRSKYFRLQLKEWWDRIWRVLFYLIRISFGILLIVSIVLIFVAIIIIITAANSSRNNDDNRSDSGGSLFMPRFWFSPDFFWVFSPNSFDHPHRQPRSLSREEPMNFLEAVFSFLFGDGNPNADLEERRWQAIATVIRNHQGAVVADQIAPYLDNLGQGYAQEYEEYMLPVLSRFNGRPEVSPEGGIIYHFPDLQTTAAQQRSQPVSAYLKEVVWKFSQAGSGQLILAGGLGVLNLGGAVFLGRLLADGVVATQLGGLVAFVQAIYWLLLAYGIGFLGIPLVRYFWIQWHNRGINRRNEERQERADSLNQPEESLQKKIAYAQQFAAETVIRQADLIYTTERELLEQEVEQSDKIDAEWQQRINQG